MTYILLIALIAIIVYHVIRMRQLHPPQTRRRPQEPALNMTEPAPEPHESALYVEEEPTVSAVRIIRPASSLSSTTTAPAEAAPFAAQPEQQPALSAASNELIILHLYAESTRPYQGYELLQALLTAGLRYGKKGIFHRFEEITGRGHILFSLASIAKPGTFDLPKMGSFSTPGLLLFLQVSEVKKPVQALDMLLATAKELTEDLGGAIYDEQRRPLTQEKIVHWRQQLRALEPNETEHR